MWRPRSHCLHQESETVAGDGETTWFFFFSLYTLALLKWLLL